ncbi:MAG: alpha/beta fold hydrolase [Candidatus Sphingomonas phytovorans]|nr:alpha/beta fold hydrolase [Sphingomonas sp.]WEK01968.1 MAG: alpha/beta fold hydrolase [Sphingomonas sp.]
MIGALLMAMISPQAIAQPMPDGAIEAPGPSGPLRGTLVEATGTNGTPAPMVLIIPGSGPTNRDGDSPLGVRGAVFRQLAEGLAARGIGSVRIDKRGMFGSAGAIADANDVTIADYASDVRGWIGVIRKRTGVPCVWVLGHSEGGLVALAAAQEATDICGLLLVATAGRPMGEVLRAQLRANPANAPILASALAAIDSLEAGRKVDVAALHPAVAGLFDPRVQSYLIDAFRYDPARLVAAVKGPVLILQGKNDIQVGIEDASLLKNARPAAKMVTLAGVNHVLKPVASDGRGANVATYGDPAIAIDPTVTDTIATMILAGTAR